MDACIVIDADELDTLLSRREVKARTAHVCEECRDEIRPGNVYRRESVISDGRLVVHTTCRTCSRIRDAMFTRHWYWGRMWDAIHEEICMDYADPDEKFCVCP